MLSTMVHETYIVSGSPGEALAALKWSTLRLGWDVEEETTARFFAFPCRRIWRMLWGGFGRLAVGAGAHQSGSLVGLTVWGMGSKRAHETIWRHLVDAGLADRSVWVQTLGDFRPKELGRTAIRLDSVLATPRFATWAGWGWGLLVLGFGGLAFWLHAPYPCVVLGTLLPSAAVNPLIREFAARRALGIRSKRGIWAASLVGLFSAALGCAIGWGLASLV